ncbi:MAG: UDP-N-acetylmuramoyl-L-alanyl-D-glutamate--2,6-diaminopimelate ligase [Faecousia sp.]
MKLSQLLSGVEVLETHVPDMELTGVAYDSRRVKPGDVFVAISGFATDGNRYIPKAMEQGARVVVTDRKPQSDVPYVLVTSSRLALAVMSANWYDHPAGKMTMIGVTGTNGKTSVTLLLKSVLEQVTGCKVGLVGTIQNMIGDRVIPTERTTPESLELQGLFAAMAEAGCRYVVMEVSSHALALERVGGVRFHAAAFTNLTEDHLDFHKTMENYAEAKALLFDRCDVGVFNLDDDYCGFMMERSGCKRLTCSEKEQSADLFAHEIQLASDHVSFTLAFRGENFPVKVNIPGLFTAYNAMTVLGLAAALELPMEASIAALGKAQGVKGRVEVVPTPETDFTVLIDYAHTPDSLENVLRSVRGYCMGRLVAVFGCGGDRDPIKRPVMGAIGVREADFVVFTSDNPRTEDPDAILKDILAGVGDTRTPYVVIENRPEAIRYALDHGQKDDIIVLAGKGHETYQEICGVKRHLDEREVVAQWLCDRKEKR